MTETYFIETERCFLNKITPEDFDKVFGLYQSESARLFLGGCLQKNDFDLKFQTLLADSEDINWSVRLKEDNIFLGMINIDTHHDGQYHEISYQFLPETWGNGYAFETILAVMNYAKNTIGLNSLVAETQIANTASIKLLQKLGLSKIKTVKRHGEEQALYKKDLT